VIDGRSGEHAASCELGGALGRPITA
jgi:hypothetical protein